MIRSFHPVSSPRNVFHIHFFHQDMEDYEIELNRPVVHRFVNHMLALLNGGPGGA